MPFYKDLIYWILLIPVLILSVYAQIKVSSSFNKYSGVRNRRGVTGAQAAYAVLRAHGVHDVAPGTGAVNTGKAPASGR